MPRNNLPKLQFPKGSCVKQVRDNFLERVYERAPDEFHPQDIQHVQQMDFLCQRFVILARRNVDQAVKLMERALRWRKEKGLHDLVDEDFLQEFTLSKAIFIYEPDRFGNRTLYVRPGFWRNCSEFKSSLKDFLSYKIFKIDDSQNGTSFSVVLDLTNASWANYDIELTMHMISLVKDYFPANLDYVLAINFPRVMTAAWTLIKKMIPTERRDITIFISSDKIFDYVEPSNCPPFLGGTCSSPIAYAPKGSPTSADFLLRHYPNISRKRLEEIFHMYSDILPEEHQAMLRREMDLHRPNK